MIKEDIKTFAEQFAWHPRMENAKQIKHKGRVILLGMGGSHLAGGLVNNFFSHEVVYIHHNYGLPAWPDKELKKSLVIASSYSGNTEEVIDGLEKARQKKCKIVVMASGGKLIRLAKKYRLPFIALPSLGMQPRMALGYSTKALLRVLGKDEAMHELTALHKKIKPGQIEQRGKKLAQDLSGFVPVIYTSEKNIAIAYNWKIKFNETGKIPAFYNTLPELNHNEMTGFDSHRTLIKPFYFIFLKDDSDNQKVLKRMNVLAKLLEQKKLPVMFLTLSGQNIWQKIFSSLILADWTAYYTAGLYGSEPEEVPMVENFKRQIK